MHSKVMIADQRFAITGGRNIEDAYFDLHVGLNFQDRDILVEGSVSADIQHSYDRFWQDDRVVDSRHLKPLTRENGKGIDYDSAIHHPDLDTLRQRVDERLAGRGIWTCEPLSAYRLYYHADPPGKATKQDGLVTTGAISYLLCAAEQEILLQSPYFVTTSVAEAFFIQNEQRDTPVAIRVHTNSLAATDNWATYAAYQREKRHLVHYPNLELFEFMPRPRDLEALWSMDPTAVSLRARNGDGKAFLCLHAKSMVFDHRIAVIGSFNLDPRSANLNTEVMLEIDDPTIASRLADSIARDMAPHNSWVSAKRLSPLGEASINNLMARASSSLSRYLFVDIWPIANTSLYRMKDGREPCSHNHPEFFERYQAVGSFPESKWDGKVLSAELFRTTGAVFNPTL
jgi:phosphatidylserine/phosphatidylglycerophosphate/cardiolipin synthase-like enzyme